MGFMPATNSLQCHPYLGLSIGLLRCLALKTHLYSLKEQVVTYIAEQATYC